MNAHFESWAILFIFFFIFILSFVRRSPFVVRRSFVRFLSVYLSVRMYFAYVVNATEKCWIPFVLSCTVHHRQKVWAHTYVWVRWRNARPRSTYISIYLQCALSLSYVHFVLLPSIKWIGICAYLNASICIYMKLCRRLYTYRFYYGLFNVRTCAPLKWHLCVCLRLSLSVCVCGCVHVHVSSTYTV